jgi:anti-anti-sigma regulatory factor
MTCKIEQITGEAGITVFRLSGHFQSEHVNKMEELISGESSQVWLDLSELTLVDRDVVSYLALCKLRGIQLRNSPRFLTEWISKEQSG